MKVAAASNESFNSFINFILQKDAMEFPLSDYERIILQKWAHWMVKKNEYDPAEELSYVTGGSILIATALPSDMDAMHMRGIPRLDRKWTEHNGGMDAAYYLDKQHKLALVMSCTNDAGGDMFILREDVTKEVTFHHHMLMAKYWLNGCTDVEIIDKALATTADEIEATQIP